MNQVQQGPRDGDAMTRQQMIELLLMQAKRNGFEFRKWYRSDLQSAWIDFEASVANLARGKRYYSLLFSHDFARHFWKPGGQISFIVPTSTYTRRNKQGEMITVTRKAFTRRTLKSDAWMYHLREMAAREEPLEYIRRFVVRKEDLEQYRSSGHFDDGVPTFTDSADRRSDKELVPALRK